MEADKNIAPSRSVGPSRSSPFSEEAMSGTVVGDMPKLPGERAQDNVDMSAGDVPATCEITNLEPCETTPKENQGRTNDPNHLWTTEKVSDASRSSNQGSEIRSMLNVGETSNVVRSQSTNQQSVPEEVQYEELFDDPIYQEVYEKPEYQEMFDELDNGLRFDPDIFM